MHLTDRVSWKALKAHRLEQSFDLASLFARDPHRAEKLFLQQGNLRVDYSKNRLTEKTTALLFQLARDCELENHISALFEGLPVNFTENRPALHMMTRAVQPLNPQTAALQEAVLAEDQRLMDFVDSVHQAGMIKNVIHIGIGGPFLGCTWAYEALQMYARYNITVHFLSTLDATRLAQTLGPLDPHTTLAIIASKSFTTEETKANAQAVWQWMQQKLPQGENPADHFVAVTANTQAAIGMGLSAHQVFKVWPWVGGRYSLYSAMGLPIALACGTTIFRELRQGAATMDEHFYKTPLEHNMPVLLGLITLWYSHFWGAHSRLTLPYIDHCDALPSYIQQVEMESLGKGITRLGTPVDYPTGVLTWGAAATQGQHTFAQLLMQGTHFVPVDIIMSCRPTHGNHDFHQRLVAHALAQGEARMLGQDLNATKALLAEKSLEAERINTLAPHLVMPGNLPSTFIVMQEANAHALGMLSALYEHSVYVQSVLYDINAFDQWGVEFAKHLSTDILAQLSAKGEPHHPPHPSTQTLIQHIQSQQIRHTT